MARVRGDSFIGERCTPGLPPQILAQCVLPRGANGPTALDTIATLDDIRIAIARAALRLKQGRVALTSNDPEYRAELDAIRNVLGSLWSEEAAALDPVKDQRVFVLSECKNSDEIGAKIALLDQAKRRVPQRPEAPRNVDLTRDIGTRAYRTHR